jgi:PAS domain S-box-containing protein
MAKMGPKHQCTGAVAEANWVVFQSLFESSVDAIWLYDPQSGLLTDCNQAAVELMGAENKEQLVPVRLEDISPAIQTDGSRSIDKTAEITAIVQKQKTHRFEWLVRRRDGREVPVEVSSTAVLMDGKPIHVVISRDISERETAELKLMEMTQALERRVNEGTDALTTSEARLRALVEHAPEAIVVFNGDNGRFLFGNKHACSLYGVPMAKLAELTPAEVSPEFQPCGRRSSELAREKLDEALQGGTPVFDWIHQQPNGRLVPTEVRLLHLPAEGQNLIRASIIDNTERKRAEDALRESEAKFRALFEGSSQGVILHDGNEILELNTAALRILGCQDPHELIGKSPRALAAPVQPKGETRDAMCRKYIEQCMTSGSARFEFLANGPNGKEIPLEVALTRIEWSGRQIIQAFITDITERKRTEAVLRASEARLRESEARFSKAFQASPVFISIFRVHDEKYVLANDALVNWVGYPRNEVLGRTSAELGMWDHPPDREVIWRELRTLGSIRQRECRWRNRAGDLFTILLSVETITLGDEPHVLSMALDITKRKQAEVEVLKALAREKELSQLKSNFVSMVSHEFRTPLGIIQSSAELLRDFFREMPLGEQEAQLESITRNTRRMAGMMEEILVLSRLDAGKLEFQPSRMDLTGCFRRIADEVLSATNRRCSIQLCLPQNLPQGNADERLLSHIFTNLLSNAIKYSEPGALVRFSVEKQGASARCVISDQGIGITQEDQKRLFTAFHRGANVGNRSGTGLGLLLVKRCVELHHGKVQIQSKLGKGTTVIVTLPFSFNEL